MTDSARSRDPRPLCALKSRNGNTFREWPCLRKNGSCLRATDALVDGEMVCIDTDGRANFRKLLYRREWPFFLAFDLLCLGGATSPPAPLIRASASSEPSCRALRVGCSCRCDSPARRGVSASCASTTSKALWRSQSLAVPRDGQRTNWLKNQEPQRHADGWPGRDVRARNPWRVASASRCN